MGDTYNASIVMFSVSIVPNTSFEITPAHPAWHAIDIWRVNINIHSQSVDDINQSTLCFYTNQTHCKNYIFLRKYGNWIYHSLISLFGFFLFLFTELVCVYPGKKLQFVIFKDSLQRTFPKRELCMYNLLWYWSKHDTIGKNRVNSTSHQWAKRS